MNINQLRYFISVVEQKSFTKAAAQHGVPGGGTACGGWTPMEGYRNRGGTAGSWLANGQRDGTYGSISWSYESCVTYVLGCVGSCWPDCYTYVTLAAVGLTFYALGSYNRPVSKGYVCMFLQLRFLLRCKKTV